MTKVRCPCCGFLTLDEPGVYDICPICGWEDDPIQSRTPSYAGGANRMSLEEARSSFQETGVSETSRRHRVRPATPQDWYERLRSTPFPSRGRRMPDFPEYDSVLAGYLSKLAHGIELPVLAIGLHPPPTVLAAITQMREKASPGSDEVEFLHYFDLLEKIRSLVVSASKDLENHA